MNRREFIKIGAAAAIGAGVASAIEIPILENSISNDNSKIKALQTQITQSQAFLTLNPTEQPIVEALAEAVIPTDSMGPGAKEAGVVYFIDRMLAGNYGKGGNMFLQGPFMVPQSGSVTVMGAVYPSQTKSAITYSGGTIKPGLQAGTSYQYAFNPREFWRRGLVALENYCASAKGGKFENLDSATQIAVLQEMFDNKADNSALQTAFQGPNAAEFFNEIHDLVTAGFWADPIYGGNQNLVGWKLIGFNGNNWGDDIGLGAKKLMVASTPTRLTPKSLGQLQQEGGGV
ncbi:MAG TPA: gluconate 2-dehydrogenase subunit 3 family protein [Candidatus Binatia bacterium]|nr:gluconate 2-dehydrogenase subunit 3 family protein [Candidatus Binatia bacterium]